MKSSSSKNQPNFSSKAKTTKAHCSHCQEFLGEIKSKTKVEFGPRAKKRKFFLLTEDTAQVNELNGDVDMNKEQGDDIFCGFSKLRCPKCADVVGRKYLSSSGKIDQFVGKILLHVEKVKEGGLHDGSFEEPKPHGVIENEKRFDYSPIKERTPKGRLDEEPIPGSRSRPELNEAMPLTSDDEDEVDEELGALEKLKQEQRGQIRMLKNNLLDFAEVIADIDDRVKRAEKDVGLLNVSLKKVYSLITQENK
jgi:hypothetical protein